MNPTSSSPVVPVIHPGEHHVQCEFCHSRAAYRQGKEFKAVKVYTVNEESKHLIIQNIPAVGLHDELEKLCSRHGTIKDFKAIQSSEYPPREPFTSVYYVQYSSPREAKFAKIKLDNRSFYGGIIHICYAPELETVEDTREKLLARRRFVQSYFTKKGKKTFRK